MNLDERQIVWPPTMPGPWSGHPPVGTLQAVVPLLMADPAAEALTFEDGASFTRGELLSAIRRFGGFLSERVEPGDRVLLGVSNRVEFLIAWLGILANGAVPVMVDPAMGPYEAGYIVSDSEPVAVVVEGRIATLLDDQTLAPDVALIRVEGPEPHGLERYRSVDLPVDQFFLVHELATPAGINYTSGTTGPPKGCIQSHLQFSRYADVYLRLYPFRSSDVILNLLQFHYGDALWMWIMALRLNARYVSVRRFSVRRFWTLVTQFRVTTFFAIGAIPTLLLKGPCPSPIPSTLRFALQVAVPRKLHQELIDRFGFPWIEVYGLSESGPVICMPPAHAENYIDTGAIGIPAPEVEVKVVAEGSVLEGACTGELFVRSPGVMIGYLNHPSATAEVLNEGWLRTGDMVRRDASGVYYFLGRIKSVIRRGGQNVAPAEVEAVLSLHPKVHEAAVIPVGDELMGEEIKAIVLMRAGQSFEPEALARFCGEKLAAFKVPRYFEERIEPFPRTASMRIRKELLAENGVKGAGTAWDSRAFQAQVEPTRAGCERAR